MCALITLHSSTYALPAVQTFQRGLLLGLLYQYQYQSILGLLYTQKASHLCYGANEFKCVWLAFNQFKCNQQAYLCEIAFIYCVIHMPTTLVMTTQHKSRNGHHCAQSTPADRMALRQDSGYFIPQDCSSKIHTHKIKSVNDNTHTIPCAHSQCLLLASSFMASALCSIHVCRRLGETS